MSQSHFVYLVQCRDGTLYAGYTTDIARRVAEHNAGAGRSAKYTRARRPVTLVYAEVHQTRAAAQQRERVIKRLSRAAKLTLIASLSMSSLQALAQSHH